MQNFTILKIKLWHGSFYTQSLQNKKIKLLTNNPHKISSLKTIEVVQRVPIVMDSNEHNEDYLGVKKDEMGHIL